MLVGVAALSAWGLYRFNEIMATLPKPTGTNVLEIATKVAQNSRTAYTMQFGEIFYITAFVCAAGAVLALFIGGKHTHADETEKEPSLAVGR